MKDTVVIYSGGMDSFTLLNETHNAGRLHTALSFNYGQRHAKELHYATRYCIQKTLPHEVFYLQSLRDCFAGSALTTASVDVPHGHYAEESMKQTVVPSRNLVMLSLASAYAVSHGASRVLFGAHAGDHAIYPDCRPEFVSAVNTATLLANWKGVTVEAPYLSLTKRDILLRGYALNPLLDYAQSWTCYEGAELSCGKCGSCQERLEAFNQIGRMDPLEYAS